MTDIPYCDATWDLTIGCRKRSPACKDCWACRTVHRLRCKGMPDYMGQTTTSGDDWRVTDSVNFLEHNLTKPMHWRKPRFVFVNSKSDLFDERVPFEFIGEAFNTMGQARQHRFMILTKEPPRLAEFVQWYTTARGVAMASDFPHVILMVSVEGLDQLWRLDELVQIPAAMRGVSLEPLIDPVSDKLGRYLWRDRIEDDGLDEYGNLIDWVVVGCEKLLGGRAGRWTGIEPELWWQEAERIVKACQAAGVPCWVKQGPRLTPADAPLKGPVRVTHNLYEFPAACRVQEKPKGLIP